MNDKLFHAILQATINTSSLVEAICGKKAMRKIQKRLSVLTEAQIAQIWIVLHNLINPFNPFWPGPVDMEMMPILLDEAERIHKMILDKNPADTEALNKKLNKIIERKMRFAEQVIVTRKTNGN